MRRVYIITESGVNVYNSLTKMNREISLDKHELTEVGSDLVCNMTDMSYQISKDIRLLETVATRKIFSKDKFDTSNWLQAFSIVLLIILLFHK